MLYEKERELKAPANVHIEFTNSCNEKCRHCYNYWREEGAPISKIDRKELDKIIDQLIEAGVFHVILTGGEPLINSDEVIYAAKRLTKNRFTISMNSNLIAATEDKMKALRDAGLKHVLSSLLTYDEKTHDHIASVKGAWVKCVKGIETTLGAGITITNNMVISQVNKDHVYETGKFLHSIGVTGICGTRVSPPPYADIHMQKELQIPVDDARAILEDLLRIKSDFGMRINALLPFPLCFLKDCEKYIDFAGRKCAGGTYTLSLNSNGDAHACQKEGLVVGNILRDGIYKVWENVRHWRTKEQIPEECQDCAALPECGGGCRTVGLGYEGSLNGKDNLTMEPIKDKDVTVTQKMWRQVDNEYLQFVHTLRFRQENGFTLLNINAAKNIMISDAIARIVKDKFENSEIFNLESFGKEHRIELGHFIKKGAVRIVKKQAEVSAVMEKY